jgi:hypothetical protein
MIRPEFWSDEKIGSLTHLQRLLFVGMWNFADDEGLIRANPLYLRSTIFPYDDLKEKDILTAIETLKQNNLIYLYTINGQKYAWIIKFRVYQRIDKPQQPNNPIASIQNKEFKEAIFKRDGYRCHLCKRTCDPFGKLNVVASNVASIDHIIPQSKGGGHYPSNLITACISCNKGRGNKSVSEYLEIVRGTIQEEYEIIPVSFIDETETETEVKQKQKPKPKPVTASVTYSDDFLKWYEKYPNKVNRKKAFEAWGKVNRPSLEILLQKLNEQIQGKQEMEQGKMFVPDWPHPTTYLNGERWEDIFKVSGNKKTTDTEDYIGKAMRGEI